MYVYYNIHLDVYLGTHREPPQGFFFVLLCVCEHIDIVEHTPPGRAGTRTPKPHRNNTGTTPQRVPYSQVEIEGRVDIDTGTEPMSIKIEGAVTYTSEWLNATFQAAGVSTVCQDPGTLVRGTVSVYFSADDVESPDKRAFSAKGSLDGFRRCPHLISETYPEYYIFKLGVSEIAVGLGGHNELRVKDVKIKATGEEACVCI